MRIFLLFISLSTFIYAQYPGDVTGITLTGNKLTLQAGADKVVLEACSENVVKYNYLPNGIESPDTLIVANTSWNYSGGVFDTSSSLISLTTPKYKIEIQRYPIRISGYSNSGELLFQELSTGGISVSGITINTSGGNFYGVHNRKQGFLQLTNGDRIFAGKQGEAGAPFIWTNKGWGLLADIDSGRVDLNATQLNLWRKAGGKNDMEVYFLFGTPKEIFNGMTDVSGKPPLFPRFTLGFMNTEWGINESELLNDVNTYRSKHIPLDAYILDFDWMAWGSDNYGEFRFGPKFPSAPNGVLKNTLLEKGAKLMGIRKPRIHVNTVQGAYAESHNFFVDHVIDYFSGGYVGRLNFNRPDVRQWFWNSFVQNNSYKNGIIGYWNDEADEYGGNFMFLQMQRSEYEGQRNYNNNRVWSINRNFFLGAQRYAYGHWSGDINTGFYSMAEQALFMNTSILLGSEWWGMDIGGFNGTPTPENYYRWIQFGTFVPIFRVHGTLNQEREPWNYGQEAETIADKFIKIRYSLLPYIYSAAWENHLNGTPLVRPLVFEFPEDNQGCYTYDEWMFGDDILVKPVLTEGANQVDVYFPEGKWIDYWDGKHVNGPLYKPYTVTSNFIPLFVKAGSVIPGSLPGNYSNDSLSQAVLVFNCYPDGNSSALVYEDDGITYNYENGFYSITNADLSMNDNKGDLFIHQRTGNYTPVQRDYIAKFLFLKNIPDSVKLNDNALSKMDLETLLNNKIIGWAFDPAVSTCYIRFPDNGLENHIAIKGILSSISDNIIPEEFKLEQNFPNPFNPNTTIRYSVAQKGFVSIKVFDIMGRETAVLVNEEKEKGNYSVQFDGRNFASGVYFYKFNSGKYFSIKKMLLLK